MLRGLSQIPKSMSMNPRRCWLRQACTTALSLAAPAALRANSPTAAPAAPALELKGAGASFPSKVYRRWGERYAEQTGAARIRYEPTGSGDGIQQATARTVDFGGTDSPLKPAELADKRLIQVPMLVGGVVPVVKLPGLAPNRLLLSGELLADLMSGRIARWNDARVAALNPSLSLPALPVVPVVRSDRSGTTDGFSRFLARTSERFRTETGAGQLPKWAGAPRSAQGNDGVASLLAQTEGGLSYLSYDRASAPGMTPVRLLNAAGRAVAGDEAGFRAAILASDLHRLGDDTADLLLREGDTAWPITLSSFVLLDARPSQAARASAVLSFVYWCFLHGDALTRGTGFAPLPIAVQARVAARLASVRDAQGQPLRFVTA